MTHQEWLRVPWCSGPSYRVLVPVTEVRILPGLPLAFDGIGVVSEVSGDVLLMALEGAAAYLQQLSVAPQHLDHVLTDLAVASHHLNGPDCAVLARASAVLIATDSYQEVRRR